MRSPDLYRVIYVVWGNSRKQLRGGSLIPSWLGRGHLRVARWILAHYLTLLKTYRIFIAGFVPKRKYGLLKIFPALQSSVPLSPLRALCILANAPWLLTRRYVIIPICLQVLTPIFSVFSRGSGNAERTSQTRPLCVHNAGCRISWINLSPWP